MPKDGIHIAAIPGEGAREEAVPAAGTFREGGTVRGPAWKAWIAGGVLWVVVAALAAGAAWAQKKVVYSDGPDAQSLDWSVGVGGSADSKQHAHLYDTLVFRDVEGTIRPGLATSWKFENPTTLVFQLRRGVRFHDGTPFNAAAVKFSIERTLKHPLARTKIYIAAIKGVRVVDDFTAEVSLKYPYAPILANLAIPVASIGSPAAVARWGEEFRRRPVGTGPFILKKWVPGEYIQYEANPHYWGGRPAIDELEHRVVPEATTRVLQLRAGQLQLATFLPPSQMGEVEKDPKLDLVKMPIFRVVYIGMDTHTRPFDNVLVRRAVNYAVDTRTIVEKVMLGVGVPLRGPYGPALWGYDPEFERMGYRHDPEKARELLRQAGYPDGFDTEFWHPTGRYTDDKMAAEAIQAQLARVGIRAKLRTGDWGLVVPVVRKGKAPMYMFGIAAQGGDADNVVFHTFHSSSWGPPGNYNRYKNPRVDTLIEEARATLDPARRKALYKELSRIVVEDAPWLFFNQEVVVVGVSKRLKGAILHPAERIYFHKARLAD